MLVAGVVAVLFLSLVVACKKDTKTATPSADNTITGIVSSNASFSLLKSPVVKAGLATTLSGTGPFTVFAPSDTAFAGSGINAATIASLSTDQLKTILLYHTIPAKILAADVPAGPNAKVITAGGDSVFVTKNGNGVFVNGIPVTQADIMASNGVIHASEFKGGLQYAAGLGLKIPFNHTAGFLISLGYNFQTTSYVEQGINTKVDYSRLAVRAGFFL